FCLTVSHSTTLFTLSLHDALPILLLDAGDARIRRASLQAAIDQVVVVGHDQSLLAPGQAPRLSTTRHRQDVTAPGAAFGRVHPQDRKSTRLNSSHLGISYAVFCLK